MYSQVNQTHLCWKNWNEKKNKSHETIMACNEFIRNPKGHLIFEQQAADDQAMFDGISDKIEDPIEKRHQEQMRIDHILLSKMHGGFKARMITRRYE